MAVVLQQKVLVVGNYPLVFGLPPSVLGKSVLSDGSEFALALREVPDAFALDHAGLLGVDLAALSVLHVA